MPNTTHVMQETDKNYGPFKTQFSKNLEDIVDARLKAKKGLSLQPKFVGLPLFGGVDRETGFEDEVADSALQKGFRKERSLVAWKKVGAALEDGLITGACLDNLNVLRDLTFGQNEKSGMDDEEFKNNLMNLIVPLYPNAKDRPGSVSF
jgi:hypothetical protein